MTDDYDYDSPYTPCELCDNSRALESHKIFYDGQVWEVCECCYEEYVKEEMTAEFLPFEINLEVKFCKQHPLWINELALMKIEGKHPNQFLSETQNDFIKEHQIEFNEFFVKEINPLINSNWCIGKKNTPILWVRNPYILQKEEETQKQIEKDLETKWKVKMEKQNDEKI